MELVYLWVEKYKNIEKQGFNFSPKFRCEYNPETTELKIEENPNYVSIFPENINITAIVGKNGSGKSSVVKAILSLFFYSKFKDEFNKNFQSGNGIKNLNNINNNYAIQEIQESNLIDKIFIAFLIVKDKNKFFKLSVFLIKNDQFGGVIDGQYAISNVEITKIDEINFFSIYYNFTIDTLKDGMMNQFVDLSYHRVDEYESPVLIEPYKKNNLIDINLINFLTNQRILLFYSFLKDELINNNITTFFNPDRVKFKYDRYKKEFNKDERFEQYKILAKYINLKTFFLNGDSFSPSNEIKRLIENYYKENNLEKLNLVYILLKIIEKSTSIKEKAKKENLSFLVEYVNNLKNKIKEDFVNAIEDIEDFINNRLDDKILKFFKENPEFIKIYISLLFHKNKRYEFLKKEENFLKKEILLKNLPKENIIEYFPGWLNVEFYDGDKSLNSLSSGEKFKFQFFLIGLLYQLYNLNSKDKYSTINIFLDEIEFGFHPEWQRTYINDILFILDKFKKITNFNKRLNLFFLTHSPFIISDLPKENIIFLDRDKNGKCKVVDGLNEKKETFGANIHTLLSDSFFMEDGFIGKFAENKIDEVIKYLNDEDSEIKTEKEAQKIINIIGEPILRKELQRKLDSKRLEKVNNIDEKIKQLEYELEILKQHQTKQIKDELLDRGKREYFLKKKNEKNNNN